MKLTRAIFCVVDCETTGLKAKIDHLVQVGIHKFSLGSRLESSYEVTVKPPVSIPAITSAIHHITDRDVEDLPGIGDHLQEIAFEVKDADSFVAHNAAFDSAFMPFLKGRWICTQKTAKILWMGKAEAFSNQYLRYWLDLRVNCGPAHSALADVAVTTAILRREIEEYLKRGNEDDLDSFITYGSAKVFYSHFPFGKHKGESLSDVARNDRPYLSWVLESMKGLDKDMRYSIEKALRGGVCVR